MVATWASGFYKSLLTFVKDSVFFSLVIVVIGFGSSEGSFEKHLSFRHQKGTSLLFNLPFLVLAAVCAPVLSINKRTGS